MRGLFSFPNPVNEVAARTVAAGVVALCLLTLGLLMLDLPAGWALGILAYGFVARVLTGPTPSPLGQLAVRVVAPRLAGPCPVPGPPKRFAQAIGATLSVPALISYLAGATVPVLALVSMIAVAAVLESAFALCLGCTIFGRLQAVGLVPITVCEACNDVRSRYAAATP